MDGGDIYSATDSMYLLTLRIIPKATQVNNKEVPPILISGRVKPVTGSTFRLIAM